VNSNAENIDDAVCYKSIDALPAEVSAAVVLTHKKETLGVVEQLIKKSIKQIWIQQGSDTAEAIEYAKKNYANLINGKCIIMFSGNITGIHKFHYSMLKFFGRLPK
jgi:predicted CoA-binding protein